MNQYKFVNQAVPAAAGNKFWNFINQDDKTAELELFGTISSEEDWWSDDCVTYRNFINELNALGRKELIQLKIHSCGGDVFAANAIYTALLTNSARIEGTVLGLCASAATIPLMACEVRRISKTALFMMHNPKITLWGQYEANELLKLSEVTEQVKASIMAAYKSRLEKTDEEISALMDAETWLTGQEAVNEGFCDEIIEEPFVSDPDIMNRSLFIVNGTKYNFTNYVENFVPDHIRKKVLNFSQLSQKNEGTFFDKNNQKGNQEMSVPTIQNAEQLINAYPALVKQIEDQAVINERKRLQAIDEISNGLPNEILNKAKYEEPMTAEALALEAMKANNKAGSTFFQNMVDDIKDSGTDDIDSEPKSDDEKKGGEKEQKVSNFANFLKADKRRK